jgi:hypothetical protein
MGMTRQSGLISARARRADSALLTPHGGLPVHDLALQIGQVHDVAVADGEMADPGGSQVEAGGRAQPAGADEQDMALEQLGLARKVDLGQQDVAAVADELAVVHGGLRGRTGCGGFVPPFEKGG